MPARYRSALFIIADDWSPLAGCYGSPVIQTPNIDRFAERGVVFDHAFCVAPSCAASRAGRSPAWHCTSAARWPSRL